MMIMMMMGDVVGFCDCDFLLARCVLNIIFYWIVFVFSSMGLFII